MSTPWILASGTPGRWTGTYVHQDGDAEGVLAALEPVLVAFGGDLEAALEGMFSAPLGWRILGVDAFDPDDAEQAWVATGRETPGLGPADRVCLDHTVTWAILDPRRRCVRLQQPGGDVFATHPIDDEGHIEGRPPPRAPIDPAEILRRAEARWPGGDFEVHPELHEVFRFRTVVDVVSDPVREMTLAEAREVDLEAELGDVLGELVTEAELDAPIP